MSRSRRQTIAVAIFLIVAIFFFTTFRMAVVHGDSMLPTYRDGQVVLVNKRGLFSSSLDRGDVVLIQAGNEVLIKRIAYLPGEIIPVPEAFRFAEAEFKFEKPADTAGRNRYALKVPAGHYVVLGDNPPRSDDSRAFGPVPARDILGRVVNAPPKP